MEAREGDSVAMRLERKTRQLRAVGEISTALGAARELEATLDVITRITSDVMGVASCSIYLQESGTDHLILKATTGLARAAIGIAWLRTGEGLTGWTVTHGAPIAVEDARRDKRFKLLPETDEEGLLSLMAVPLTVQGRTIGAMNVQTSQAHAFDNDEVELLSMIANLAAGAIEKAALHDHMRRQIQDLEGLLHVSRTLVSPLYLDEMLGVIAEMAARVMGAKAVILHLLDESTGRFHLRSAHNTSVSDRVERSFALGEGLVGQVAKQAKPMSVPDVRTDPSYRNVAVANAEGLVSLLAVPLSVRDRTIGVLSCFMAVRHDFGAKEVDVLSMLGNQAALAIENARLALSAAVVREMHHRVKNNLQTVAMLLRLQMGGADDERIRGILTDAVSRVLNIAAVHETLSESGLRMVDIREVLGRIARNMAELAPGRNVEMQVEGDLLHLPSRSATSLALVVGELVQNAMKHAFQGREHGRITIQLTAGDLEHQVAVFDDGVGNSAPRSTRRGLGMDIIQTLVSDDLKGQFETQSTADGTRAWVRFPVVTDEGALS